MKFKDSDIVISYPKRSAIGKLKGSLSSLPAYDITAQVIADLIKDSQISPNKIDQVVLGNVLSSGQGMNPAKRSAINAGLNDDIIAFNINQVCGSGLQSIIQASNTIRLNSNTIIIAGGQESMSNAPHTVNLRKGTHLGNATFLDTLITDGLTCSVNNIHMGLTVENLAKKYNVSREEQDEYALNSHIKAKQAQIDNVFDDEITKIVIKSRKGETYFEHDEHIRTDIDPESLKKLRPAFSSDGTITAGNASGINDAAAVMLISSFQSAKENNLKTYGKIVSTACVGVDPMEMGIAPIKASRKALASAGWAVEELDLVESNEAFAASSIIVDKEMKWDKAIVNVNGGSIALGHPIGASGARIMVTMLHEMEKRDAKKGLCTVCIGGGMAIAICIER